MKGTFGTKQIFRRSLTVPHAGLSLAIFLELPVAKTQSFTRRTKLECGFGGLEHYIEPEEIPSILEPSVKLGCTH